MDKTLKEDEIKAISELRSLLKNDIPSSFYEDTEHLKRFLIARDYNVKKAEFMIRKNLKWQKEMQIETILTDFEIPKVLKKYYTKCFIGHDKDGDPIQYNGITFVDEKGLLKSANSFHVRKLNVITVEKDIRRMKPDGSGRCSQVLYIYNAYKIAFSRMLNKKAFSLLTKLTTEVQDNYPERLKNVIVINASSSFAACWSVLKEWIGSSLLNKVYIFGEDGWKEELLKRIDADVLPAFLGGNRTDPDGNPLCLETVNHGGLVPEEYYSQPNTDEFMQKPGATFNVINRHKQLTVPLEVTEPNSIINWEFIVKSFDIGFGLSLKTDGEIMEEIIPVHKMETECTPEQGKYRCKSTGSYVVIFDNCYSWMHNKEIFYRTWITSADR